MKRLLFSVLIVLAATSHCLAAEKKPLQNITVDAFIADSHIIAQGVGDNHIAAVWWIPNEFWKATLLRDTTTSESDKKAMLDVLSDTSLLAICQSDISKFGAFAFYSKEEVENNMSISFSNADSRKMTLSPMTAINPDLEIVLGVFKPILGAAMGQLGNNMHFYVLDDKSESFSRLLDPYQKGKLDIHLKKRDQSLVTASIDMPLNCLFVPRKCPNGKDAHISWEYCPWTGKRLEK